MTDYTDLNVTNGWIAEEHSSNVLMKVVQTSAIEALARRVPMSTDTVSVPRFVSDGADIVMEHAVIPVQQGTPDAIVLKAIKFANRFAISVEDSRDTFVDVLNAKKLAWSDSYCKKLDNACLGVTAAKDGTATAPYESVFHAANAAGNVTETAAALTFEMLVDAFDAIETGNFNGNIVVIAHPAFKGMLRNLKDEDGIRVIPNADALGTVPSIFGNQLFYTSGARTSATASDTPTGNPIMVVGNRDHLVLGVRDGIETALSTEERWDTDEVELKLRARRGFACATGAAFHVIELT